METLAWDRVAFATGPARDVGAAVRQAYHEAGLAAPERIVVLASPATGALAAAWVMGDDGVRRGLKEAGFDPGSLLDDVEPGLSVRDEVRTVPWERARAAAHADLGPVGWAARWAKTGGALWPRVDRIVTDIRRALADLGGEALRQISLDAVLGQHDAPWLSAFDGLDGLGGLGGLGGLKRMAETSGWWWPFERLAIVTDRPVELHLDELGRLHRADGPALSYRDGFVLHAWHGMPVPAGFGAEMLELTPGRIRNEPNAELRRVMLEHFGLERYLAESGAVPGHSDETGVLWRVDLPDDEPIVMVEVVNSTPEPDGTSRTYFLRVPPWVSRAREGVAWTFGVSEHDYRPELET
ncbi:DUF6745 domain-containing protein [Nonomuraea sp. NPDC048916]|uniref:DUF6745 domain-containing protein n=1 Tax=Nonomuraea sp. NPDC048916 TaxID=3154232 RepID=UPI0033ED6104